MLAMINKSRINDNTIVTTRARMRNNLFFIDAKNMGSRAG
jgi:hypothetical protein